MGTSAGIVRAEDPASHPLSQTGVAGRGRTLVLIPMQDWAHVVLTWHYRPAIGRATWELPASRLGEDESLDDAAARSCLEHFGLMPGCVQHLCGLQSMPECCDQELIFCRVTGGLWVRHGRDPHLEPVARRRTRVVTIPEGKNMIERGAIADLKTVCGLLLLQLNQQP